jgi:preprotein translocase subunit SecY
MKKLHIISTLFLVLFAVIPALAQGAPPATPIDGGLSLLLAAGGAYGIKKIRDSRK